MIFRMHFCMTDNFIDRIIDAVVLNASNYRFINFETNCLKHVTCMCVMINYLFAIHYKHLLLQLPPYSLHTFIIL